MMSSRQPSAIQILTMSTIKPSSGFGSAKRRPMLARRVERLSEGRHAPYKHVYEPGELQGIETFNGEKTINR